MQLNFQPTGGVLSVSGIDDRGIRIEDQLLLSSFLLMPDRIIPDWPIHDCNQLTVEIARDLIDLEPELILIGTGDHLIFPNREFMFEPMSHGIGMDAMDNHAACRTYNVLVAEGRRVLMAVILG